MKRIIFIPLLAITLLLLGSCNKTELNQETEMQPIQLKASTRSPQGNIEDVWRNGDKITVFAESNPVKQFQYNETDWQPVDGEAFYSEVPAVFFGVFPASNSSSFTIPTDQSTVEKMRSADYMSSDNVQLTDFRQPLNLVLSHRLAKVEITITEYQNEFGGNIPTVVNPEFKAYTHIERATDGATLLPNQELTTITPLFTREDVEGKHKFEVLIAPNEYSKQFTCEVNGVVLTSSLPSNLEGGKSYRFNLEVGKELLIFNKPQVSDFIGSWTEEVGLDYGPKVGEYLYSDGTWGPLAETKTPVGIIFSNKTDKYDKKAGYHLGYAISMAYAKEGDNSLFQYKTSNTEDLNKTWSKFTFKFKITLKQGRIETLTPENEPNPAIRAALGYVPPLASSAIPGASVWFLPSFGQWYDIFVNLADLSPDPLRAPSWDSNEGIDTGHAILNKYITDWDTPQFDLFDNNTDGSWASTHYDDEKQFRVFFSTGTRGWKISEVEKITQLKVRPAIAF